MLAFLLCTFRGCHVPVRHPLGGFLCSACGFAGADLEEMGRFPGSGYVSPLRRIYDRKHGSLTRTTLYEPTERGW